jgi:hypothetical protein
VILRARVHTRDPQGSHSSEREGRRTHRVPYLQLDLLSINGDHARAKLHADGQVMHRLEALVCELQQQA